MNSRIESAYANFLSNTAFKHLLAVSGRSENLAALSLLNSLIPDFEEDPIRSLEPACTDKEITDANNRTRTLQMDFHAITNRLEHVTIELQLYRHILFDERALAYAAVAYLQQLEGPRKIPASEWYKSLRKTYAVQFLNYDSNKITGIADPYITDPMIKRVREHPMKDGYFMKWYVFTDKFSGQEIDHIQLLQIELPRAEMMGLFPPSRDFNEKRWWMSLFNHSKEYSPEFVEKLYREGAMPQGVYEGLRRMEVKTWNSTLQKKYKEDVEEMREFYAPQIAMDMLDAKNEGIVIGKEEGIAIGEARGKEEGIAIEKRKTALKLLAKKMDIADIAEIIGLSIEEIKSLKNVAF
ncbi:MAG: PD-(D/E)XK nuclease family transposase [Holosporaceae bacterium]|nr:PD-(D/E)XK nuclease family transposase [Holosporaceae bacterium]